MEKDFHFGVTYVVARLGGLDHEKAEIVATCSQYVDDTVNSGTVNFSNGASYFRISSAHELSDYHITLPLDERLTWIPFHFVPGNDSEGDHDLEFFNRIVCRPNSSVAQDMVKSCILKQDRPFGLHQLGITAHVYIDTWAHQGFAGINHKINFASDIELIEPKDDSHYFFKVLSHGGIKAAIFHLLRPLICNFSDRFFPMGHGAVLHYPDHPFRKWSYVNGLEKKIFRDNPTDFSMAADELCKVIRRYIARDPDANVSGLPTKDRALIEQLIRELQDDDPEVRLASWLKAVEAGKFSFGAAKPKYVSSGEGSWKFQALGTLNPKISEAEKFEFKPEFMKSNWKLFHDAALAHQFDLIREILPKHGICAI